MLKPSVIHLTNILSDRCISSFGNARFIATIIIISGSVILTSCCFNGLVGLNGIGYVFVGNALAVGSRK